MFERLFLVCIYAEGSYSRTPEAVTSFFWPSNAFASTANAELEQTTLMVLLCAVVPANAGKAPAVAPVR